MPLSSHHRFNPQSALDVSGEHELQTDIMRFLAILALCLMAVFAIVQSLPMTPSPDTPADPAEDPALRQEVEALEQKLERLRQERIVISQDLEQGQQARTNLNQTLTRRRAELDSTGRQLRHGQARLERIQQEINRDQASLRQLKQRSGRESRQLTQVEQRLNKLRKELASARPPQPPPRPKPVQQIKLPEPVRALPEPIAARPQPALAPEPVSEPTSAPDPEPQPEGFTLRFASDSALRSLVSHGKVGFYANRKPRFWRLDLSRGRERYQDSSAPEAYYAMTPATVPTAFRRALTRHTGTRVGPDTLWGVTLPNEIQARVQGLMQARRGGTLVIQQDGQVGIEPGERT